MFALKGNYSEEFTSIFQAIQDVARYDPLLESRTRQSPSHPDGWGYVNINDHDLVFAKSGYPVFDSQKPGIQNGIVMVHARMASPGEPGGVFSSHPYHGSTQEIEIFMAHNGAFEKKGIAGRMGISDYMNITDSELFLHLILSQSGNLPGMLGKSIKEIREDGLMKGTPNLIIVGIDRNSQASEVLYYTDSPSDNRYGEYNKLYRIDSEKWSGVFSSSILESRYFPENYRAREVERGVIAYL
jgi:glutamine amidotransferase